MNRGKFGTEQLKFCNFAKIAFRTNNTIEKLLKQRIPISDKFISSGVYKLTCQIATKPM